MRKRETPKGSSRKSGIPVEHKFPPDYFSNANNIAYSRDLAQTKGVRAISDCCGDCMPGHVHPPEQWGNKWRYKRKWENGGLSTWRGDEIFSDGKK